MNKIHVDLIDMENSPDNDYQQCMYTIPFLITVYLVSYIRLKTDDEVASLLKEQVLAICVLETQILHCDNMNQIL